MEEDYIFEGKVKINKNYNDKIQEVFYNKVQIFNRDISLLVVLLYSKKYYDKNNIGINLLDALTASGLRALRIAKEIPNILINEIVGTDLSSLAIEHFKKNIELNNLKEININPINQDCILTMIHRSNKLKFNVIDLDPYGSAVSFLDPAIRYIQDGGLICATCTDSRVFEGSDLHKCYYLYGSSRAKTNLIQENGIRIFIGTINRIANTMGKSIKVLLSIHGGFYIRIFFEVINRKDECAKSLEKTGMIFVCSTCGNYKKHKFGSKKENKNCYKINKLDEFNTKCEICENNMQINGPIWIDEINNKEFVFDLLNMVELIENNKEDYKIDTNKKIKGILHSIMMEKEIFKEEQYFGFNIERIMKFFKSNQINKLKLYSAIINQNYKICHSYLNKSVFKTNAPFNFICEISKQWKNLQVNKNNIIEGDKCFKFVNKKSEITINFEINKDGKELLNKRIPIYFPNPEKFWGPKSAAKIKINK